MSNLNQSNINIFALGGLGEVGKNMYCIEYKNQIFIIDSGILFPDEHLLGVDYVIPDYQYLIDNEERIVGLFITHGHEDHIGGIPFLLKKVKIPQIYAAGITVDLIENKLQEHKDLKPKIVEFKSNSIFKFKGVEVSFIRMNHSIPDSFAIAFKTDLGYIVHSGDFKIDMTPVGPKCEYDKLAKLGEAGVLCLLADSTNAILDGFTISESKVAASIKDLFSKVEGRALVATFASNMYRVQQIVEASVKYKRHVAVFGRSMEKTISIGQEVGYIKAPKGTFIEPEEISNYKANEITILCTGSQGEPLAALSRIANGSHKQIKQMPGDTVIFSSSPIPGNQDGVNKTINLLFKNGANVIVNSPLTDTHTSGHAATGELKFLQNLLKPKYFMPIHGEHRMLVSHANVAIECGCNKDNCFIMDNGDVLSINKKGASISTSVQAGAIYIDSSNIGTIGGGIIKERKILSEEGLLSLVITIKSEDNTIIGDPVLVSRGFIYIKGSEELTKEIVTKTKEIVNIELSKSKSLNVNMIKNSLQEKLTRLVLELTQRKPMIVPLILTC